MPIIKGDIEIDVDAKVKEPKIKGDVEIDVDASKVAILATLPGWWIPPNVFY